MSTGPYVLAAKLRPAKGSISEFGMALFVLLFLAVFPLVNLFCVLCGACVISFCAQQGASAASTQHRYTDALTAMESSISYLLNSGFARFVKLRSVGGYHNTGADLYVDASNFASGSVQRFGPNQPAPAPLDTSSNIYECTVRMTAEVGPVLNMASIPWLGQVPGLGKPAVINLSASRAAEYPSGLEAQKNIAMNVAMPTFDDVPTMQTNVQDQSGWNNPSIYSKIAAAGEHVLATQVLQVWANNSSWTATNISVGQGNQLWIDLRSNGLWSTGSGPMVSANGDGGSVVGGPDQQPGTGGMLVGRVGSNAAFPVGSSFSNYAPNQTGQLDLIMNDKFGFYQDNVGVQTVRVILTD